MATSSTGWTAITEVRRASFRMLLKGSQFRKYSFASVETAIGEESELVLQNLDDWLFSLFCVIM
jgi:hypothetical protein